MAENDSRRFNLNVNVTGDEEVKSKLKALELWMEQARRRGEALNRMRLNPVVSLDDRISIPLLASRANRIEGLWPGEEMLARWSNYDLNLIRQKAAEEAGEFEQVFGNIRFNYPDTLDRQTAGFTRNVRFALNNATFVSNRRHISEVIKDLKETPGQEVSERTLKNKYFNNFDAQWLNLAGKTDFVSDGVSSKTGGHLASETEVSNEKVAEGVKEKTKNKPFSDEFELLLKSIDSGFDVWSEIEKAEPRRIPDMYDRELKASDLIRGAGKAVGYTAKGLNVLSDLEKIYTSDDKVKATSEVVGSKIGSSIGLTVGSLCGPMGMFGGALLGDYLGEKAAGWLVDLYRSTDSPITSEIPMFDYVPAEEKRAEALQFTSEIPMFDYLPAEGTRAGETNQDLTPAPTQVNQNFTFNVTINSQADTSGIADEVTHEIVSKVGKAMENRAMACSYA